MRSKEAKIEKHDCITINCERITICEHRPSANGWNTVIENVTITYNDCGIVIEGDEVNRVMFGEIEDVSLVEDGEILKRLRKGWFGLWIFATESPYDFLYLKKRTPIKIRLHDYKIFRERFQDEWNDTIKERW